LPCFFRFSQATMRSSGIFLLIALAAAPLCMLPSIAENTEISSLQVSEAWAERHLDNEWLEELHAIPSNTRATPRARLQSTFQRALQPLGEERSLSQLSEFEHIRPVTCTPPVPASSGNPAHKLL